MSHEPQVESGADRGSHRLLKRVIDVRPAEMRALGWSWLFIFAVLFSYYILRPIRDEMGVAGGVENLQWLFTGTLLGMLAVNPPFAALVARLPRVKFIAISYRFFAGNLLLFAVALHWATAEQDIYAWLLINDRRYEEMDRYFWKEVMDDDLTPDRRGKLVSGQVEPRRLDRRGSMCFK